MKENPFSYVKQINHKNYSDNLSGYNPFLTNRAFAYHMDTILFAEEMNQHSSLNPLLQYEFYYYAVRKGKRFGFPPKPDEETNLQLVIDYFKFSRQKALEALKILTPEDINDIICSTSKGGR